MQYKLGNIQIDLKDQTCIMSGPYISGKLNPQINLYIRATNLCNCRCEFCEYHGESTEFNLAEFERVIKILSNHGIIGKIQITGGEPTLCSDIYNIVRILRENFPNHFIGINSNGTNLETLVSLSDKLLSGKDGVSNIAISRHHYDDEINREIFGTNRVPNKYELRDFINTVGTEKIHISCNIQKSYIGNLSEMYKFLDMASSIGCTDVGFVGLMGVNNYSKKEKVDFYNILDDENALEHIKTREFTERHNWCRCANYVYIANSTAREISFYARQVLNTRESVNTLVFDGQKLRLGFSGPVINI